MLIETRSCRLVLGFIVYMAVGIAYRVTVLGVSGFEVCTFVTTSFGSQYFKQTFEAANI